MNIQEWDLDFIKKVRQKKIYLYGAGDWGHRICIWCKRNGIAINKIIVSDLGNNPKDIFGYPVMELDSENIDHNALIIISVAGTVADDIYSLLKRQGFKEVLLAKKLPKMVEGNNYYGILRKEEYPVAISQWFRKSGQILNLENPLTFNEKIQWLKLYGNVELMSELADKYRVREYVAERVGECYLIPLLGVWDNFDDIDFDKLPNQFVLKCNHGCEYNIIVKNKEDFNIERAKTKMNRWLSEDYGLEGGFETQYSLIPRKIVAETYIEQIDGDLYDYKIHCFNGEPRYIQVIGGRDLEKHKGFQMIFDLDWNEQYFTLSYYPKFEHRIEKPKELGEMLDVSRKLSNGQVYARVDLYVLESGVKFGEITFTPGSGAYPYNEFWRKEDNELLGKLIKLPID